MITQKSYTITKAEMANKKWYVVDATDMVVGRLASEIAKVLKGKHKPTFTTHNDAGDFVIVINAEKVKFTGAKWDTKVYNWHTNHIGGIKARTAKVQLEKHPEAIVEEAVRGMLGKNTLGRSQFTKLKVFVGPTHTHEAQKPEVLKFNI
ncbi:MAG: 50S ribosomal protein L13 [Bacteriovoracaceae bacterium]